MPTVKTHDGIKIFYKDWGSGQPIVFSHGWPLSGERRDSEQAADSSSLFMAQGPFRGVCQLPECLPILHL
jgi:pimeloyl-ACP methyl ester carboxylesterase